MAPRYIVMVKLMVNSRRTLASGIKEETDGITRGWSDGRAV